MVGSRRWKPAASRRTTTACSGRGSRGVARERGDGQAVRAEHGEPQLGGGARHERGVDERQPVARGGGREPVGGGGAVAGPSGAPVPSWSPPMSCPSPDVGGPCSGSTDGRTSPPDEPGHAEHEDAAPRRTPSAALRLPCPVTSVSPCSTAGRAWSCASPPLIPHGGMSGRIRPGSCSKGDHAVVARRSPARHARVTPPSGHTDRPAGRPGHPPAPRPPRPPLARPGADRRRRHPARARDARARRVAGRLRARALPARRTNWTDLAGLLAPRAAGTAVDLPGFGWSRPPAAPDYTPAGHADALLCFLAGRGRPVHLLGNSLGGAVALMVAARRPELVRSLTLVSPAMPDRRPDPRRVSDPRLILLGAAVPGRSAGAPAPGSPR